MVGQLVPGCSSTLPLKCQLERGIDGNLGELIYTTLPFDQTHWLAMMKLAMLPFETMNRNGMDTKASKQQPHH